MKPVPPPPKTVYGMFSGDTKDSGFSVGPTQSVETNLKYLSKAVPVDKQTGGKLACPIPEILEHIRNQGVEQDGRWSPQLALNVISQHGPWNVYDKKNHTMVRPATSSEVNKMKASILDGTYTEDGQTYLDRGMGTVTGLNSSPCQRCLERTKCSLWNPDLPVPDEPNLPYGTRVDYSHLLPPENNLGFHVNINSAANGLEKWVKRLLKR